MNSVLTYSDVLKETVKFYSENPTQRAINGSLCVYRADDGRMCAVGRCLEPSAYDPKWEDQAASTIIDHLGMEGFKEEYRHLNDPRFWTSLQLFHDSYRYWDNEGLTEKGKKFVKELEDAYAGV